MLLMKLSLRCWSGHRGAAARFAFLVLRRDPADVASRREIEALGYGVTDEIDDLILRSADADHL